MRSAKKTVSTYDISYGLRVYFSDTFSRRCPFDVMTHWVYYNKSTFHACDSYTF